MGSRNSTWDQYVYWLVVYLPLWKIWIRQLGWWHSQYIMENHKIHVPNHQPVYIYIYNNIYIYILCNPIPSYSCSNTKPRMGTKNEENEYSITEWTIDKWFLSHRWVQYTDGNPGDSSGSSRVKQQNNFWWMADIEPLVKWVLLWDIDQLSYNQCHWDISY